MTSRSQRIEKSPSGIRALAEALGISVATVHRALHNTGRISPRTRERVLRMAERMGYKPNLSARDLRLNRHFRISVHFPTTVAGFFDALQAGVEQGAATLRTGCEVEFHRYVRAAGQAQKSILAAIESGVHGIIMVPPNTAEMAALVQKARDKGIPVICVSTDAPESKRLAAVTAYPLCSGALAAEVLAAGMKRGSQVVILAGDLVNLNQTEKIRGFRAMLAEVAPSVTVAAVLETHDDARTASVAIRRVFENSPRVSGLYISCANSISALETLREMGRLADLSVVTTDLFPELVPFLRRGAVRATVYQCPETQGSLAIQAMYRYLMEGVIPPASIGVIPQLIMRSNLDLYLQGSPPPQRSIPKRAAGSPSGVELAGDARPAGRL